MLSGGKDSLAAIQVLQNQGYDVHGLCIDGIQGKEKVGAEKAAAAFQVPLKIVHIGFFDEETWNPWKLILRDLAMGFVAIVEAKRVGAEALATGVKLKDIENPELSWLKYFLKFGTFVLKLGGLKLIFPVWDNSIEQKETRP